jgi:hypothetical protein
VIMLQRVAWVGVGGSENKVAMKVWSLFSSRADGREGRRGIEEAREAGAGIIMVGKRGEKESGRKTSIGHSGEQ